LFLMWTLNGSMSDLIGSARVSRAVFGVPAEDISEIDPRARPVICVRRAQ